MSLERAALINLVHVARIDGSLAVEETRMIYRYGRALGQRKRDVTRLLQRRRFEVVCPTEFAETDSECVHVVRMLTRVAHSDGTLCERERRRLEAVAATLGISPLEFADICVAVGHEMKTRRMLRTSHVIAMFAIPLVGFAIWMLYFMLSSESERIERVVYQMSSHDRAEFDAARRTFETAQAAFAAKEEGLQAKIATLAQRIGDREASEMSRDEIWMHRELSDLRDELLALRDAHAIFQDIERAASPSVLLIYCRWEMERGKKRKTFSGWGTGFFARDDGLVVTNKHVVEPWLYDVRAQVARDQGYVLAEDRTQLAAWTSGTVVREDGYLRYTNGYSSPNDTLELVRSTQDVFEERERELRSGKKVFGRYHVSDESDLAVLRVTTEEPIVPLELAPAGALPDKLDPIMVLGYPGSITLRESGVAETAPSLGEVRNVETSIFVDAPIVGGNSGGPVFDLRGRVIGVSTWTYGASTVGGCIPMCFVHELLEDVPVR